MKIKTARKTNLAEGLQQLLELNFDAIEAYDIAIKKFSQSKYRAQLLEFKADHERHIRNISRFIRHNLPFGESNLAPRGRHVESKKKGEWIKTFFSSLFNRNPEEDERLIDWECAEILIAHNLQDEKRHAMWFEAHEKELLDSSNEDSMSYRVN